MKVNSKRAPFVVVAALLIGAGCQREAPTPASPAGGGTLTIGALLPLTGDAAQWGAPARNAAQLAVDEINAAGGVNGQRVALAVEDDRCDAKEGVSAFNKLVAAHKTPVVLGAVCSSVTLAVAPVANREHVTLISPASTNPKITEAGDYVFRVIPSDNLRGEVFAEYLYNEAAVRSVVMLYINNEGGVGNKDTFATRFRTLGGKILGEEAYQQGATDVRSQLTTIKSSPADAVLVVSYPADTVIVLKQAKQLAIDKPLYFQTEAVEDPTVLRDAGDAANGATYILPAAAEGPVAKGFVDSYQKKFAKAPELFAAEAYDIVYLIKEALQQNGSSPASDRIRGYLSSVHDRASASGTITFDQNGDVTKPMAIKRIVDGRPQVVDVRSGTAER